MFFIPYRITHATLLVSLHHLIFSESDSKLQSSREVSASGQSQEESDIGKIRFYIKLDAIKKSELELALNWYLDTINKQQEITEGLQRSHGV